jgi:iron complex outermembrane receptor protein
MRCRNNRRADRSAYSAAGASTNHAPANLSLARAVRVTLLAASAAAVAAPVPYARAQEPELEQIVVTGSRIRVRDFEEISPVSTVGADTIAAIGATTVDQVLNNLPQVVPGLTATSNNPSDGTATIDLRGLGPTRTLVLINGRRLTPSTQTGRVDLNNIPTSLIERVEVVTGGASAVYGSDALAGVVNFILKDDFEGVELGYQHGVTSQGDGDEDQIDFAFGSNFADGKGNITAFATYNQRDAILQADRRYTRLADGFYGVYGRESISYWSAFAGSVTGIAGRFDNSAPNPFPAIDEPIWAGATRHYVQDADGTARGFINQTPEWSDGVGDRYNFAPPNYLLTPGDRWSLGTTGRYTFNEHVEVYSDLLFVRSENAAQLAPTPATEVNVPVTSPFLSAAMLDVASQRPDPTGDLTFRRRMIEMGPRQQENTSNLFQMTLGARGGLGFKDWEYDTYFMYGFNDFDNYTFNDVSRSRFEAGIAGCPEEYVRFVPNCVPVNPFGAGTITPDAANFIRLNFADSQVFKRTLASAVINGTAVELPAGPLGFALGVEWHRDQTEFRPDINKQSGDILGFNAQQPIEGSFDVMEYFVEAAVPLVKDVTGFQDLSLELGFRYSDYSSVGGVEAYKGGLNWQVVDALRLRAMYQRAVRAPSVFELFQAGDQGFPIYTDPCAGLEQAEDPAVYAFCQAQGLQTPEDYVQPNQQVEAFFYGNPDLAEETSDTYTFGLVFTPAAVDGLSVSLDYYDIKVEDYVNTLAGGVTGIIANCFDSLDLDSAACFDPVLGVPLVYRSNTGEMKVNAPTANVSELRTKGVDLQVNYAIPVWNTINVALLATYLDTYELDGIDYKGSTGFYNIPGSFPEWKANLRLGVPIGPVTVNYQLTYIDSMINQGDLDRGEAFGENCGDAFTPERDYAPCFGTTDSTFYHDLSASWQISDNYKLTVGVNNLFDTKPERVELGIDMNTDPGTWDMLGQYWFANVRATF